MIQEGESGDKLYIISAGKLVVTINCEFIRELSIGAMFGELALLYDAPRSATVNAVEDCVLWSLKREHFKYIQAISASAEMIQRNRWLSQADEFSGLPPLDLSRLNNSLRQAPFEKGEYLFTYGEITKTCVLVEKGSASVYAPKMAPELDSAAIDKELRITRPPQGRRKSVEKMTARQLNAFLSGGDLESTDIDGGGAAGEKEMVTVDGTVLYKVCEVYEGCILGCGALRSKAGIKAGCWKWLSEDGALCPFTVIANDTVLGGSLSIDLFEMLFGSCTDVLNGIRAYKQV